MKALAILGVILVCILLVLFIAYAKTTKNIIDNQTDIINMQAREIKRLRVQLKKEKEKNTTKLGNNTPEFKF